MCVTTRRDLGFVLLQREHGVKPQEKVAGGSAASRALSPTPSRSLQFRIPRSPLRWQQPPWAAELLGDPAHCGKQAWSQGCLSRQLARSLGKQQLGKTAGKPVGDTFGISGDNAKLSGLNLHMPLGNGRDTADKPERRGGERKGGRTGSSSRVITLSKPAGISISGSSWGP
ncbi:dynein light chain 2, cytoplasmic isoform X1 [Calonectris borealis]|uniref:dynein light chain 2, cytoplasmic isoform X1 n=1 Tax=Calonectris borealis TaxID=1323832 RepID=UPI003F4BFE5A